MSSMFLEARDIRKAYALDKKNRVAVLQGVSLELAEGEFVALVGPSGSGKSTLLHIIGLLDAADSGEVYLSMGEGRTCISALKGEQSSDVRNRSIGFVFQFHHLLPEFTALENVAMPKLIAGASVAQAQSDAQVLLERVGLGHRGGHKPSELSGGEQQRVAIARALVNRPAILLADEPTGNLDSANASEVLALLFDLRREYNLTCLIATHSAELAGGADRVLRIQDGVIAG